MILKRGLIGSVGMALMITALAQAAGDEKRGEQVFNQCKPCHSLEADKNGVGSSRSSTLQNVLGNSVCCSHTAACRSPMK